MRDPGSKTRWMAPEKLRLRLFSGLYMQTDGHMSVQIHTHTHTHAGYGVRFLEIDFFKKNKITPGKNTGKQRVKSSNKMCNCGWIWHMPIIPALGSLRQEDC